MSDGLPVRPTSGESINYGIRLAKHIERKMLCDAFARLSPFGLVHRYRYIGFGSFYFTDFALFHKRLGITDMVSIEGSALLQSRCKFNKPFDCISLKIGMSGDHLPQLLVKNQKSIVWLDYDKRLNRDKLDDIETTSRLLVPGSVLLISVNAHPGADIGRVDRLREELPELLVPSTLTSADLAKWKTAKYYRSVIDLTINNIIDERNLQLAEKQHLCYEQLFNFHYKDGVEMLTVGGIIFRRQEQPKFNMCDFSELSFYRSDENELLIDVPRLTYRELRYLDSKLPRSSRRGFATHGIPDDAIDVYSEMYRYFPTYADTDV